MKAWLGLKEAVDGSRKPPQLARHMSGMLDRQAFLRLLCIERKRSERSGRRFALMLLDTGTLRGTEQVTASLIPAILRTTRDTDLLGWYVEDQVIGGVFTEFGAAEPQAALAAISRRLTDALRAELAIQDVNEIRITFELLPENWCDSDPGSPASSTLRLVSEIHLDGRGAELGLKRLIDVAGSAICLVVCAPVFLAIGIAIKATSQGPVLFRQIRIGKCGKRFTFLKFRSMYVDNNSEVHKEYVKRFIAGKDETAQAGEIGKPIYKLKADPRVTALGRLLRKTSLDELPQLVNVLLGDMSLVGPRPPVLYEFESYQLWHRRRLLVMKPGLTGPWQVAGRSRVKFDDMIRLDLNYVRNWSVWLDFKIILRTPLAVLLGEGAC